MWASLLLLAEFAYNNAPNETTGVSPFFANKGYHPGMAIYPERDMASARAREYAVDLSELHKALKSNIRQSQERYQKATDNRRLAPPDFKVGDKVFVKAKFFRTTRPTKKLSERFFGPYELLAQHSAGSYTLCLPDSM